jgi:NAD(P)-dependent dehydrogenase (short-subunit alcohol dehydrogenase family)
VNQVSVLVNNAGIAAGFGQPPLENDPDDWDAMLAVNLAAPMRLLRLLGPGMAAKPDAVVINISSVAGLYSRPHAVGYATSKWGLTGRAPPPLLTPHTPFPSTRHCV